MKQVKTTEQKVLAEQLAKLFGYYLLLLGEADHRTIRSSPIAYQVVVARQAVTDMPVVDSHWEQLPFAADSIDVLILSHALEQCADPETILLECKRVLRHDGSLIILETNPLRKAIKPGTISLALVATKALLSRLDLTCVATRRFNFFSGALGATWLETIAVTCFPWLCKSYMLRLKKQSIALTPLTEKLWRMPSWHKKPAVPAVSSVHSEKTILK